MYSGTGKGDKLSSSTSVPQCKRFSLAEIQSATKDFDDELVIGHGGFGEVYKGQLSTEEYGHVVAIKRLNSKSNQGEPEFRAEIETLSKLRHCHLVSLIGYCEDHKEMVLVYEYIQNGTLYHHLHKARATLDWVQRIKIAIGAGRGLDYLHTGVGIKEGIIHRDVKSSNILLDGNMEAKVSDFGLSKISPTNQSSSWVDASVKGTFGYLDPEYFYTNKLSRKTDVYAFGVVLFELLTGRPAVDQRYGEEQRSLVRWAQKCVKQSKLDQMVDSNIPGTIFPKCLRQFAQLADRCVHSIPKERPTMTKVVASLQAILELQLKSDNSAKSSGMMGFSWKIHKYRLAVTKQNSVPSNPYYVENVTPAPALVTDVADRLVNNTPKEHPTTREKSPTTMAELLASLEVPELEKESYDITMSSGIMSERNSIMFLEGVKAFTYDELNHATTNFQDTCLGKGIDREVYKGWVDNLTYSPCHQNSGLLVAVKRFNYCIYFDWQMLKECNHPNLVKLIGYCMEGEQLFLVYEFMNNGNLDDLLCRGVVARLPLVKKVQIAFGVARGILFLQKMHCYFGTDQMINPMFERRDIMLDKDFMAKLSDYGVLNYRTLYELYLKLKPMFERPREGRKIKKDTDMISDYVVACESSRSPPRELLRMDLSGFTMILAEVLTGRRMLNESELDTLDDKLLRDGKMSLRHIARSCFESCYEEESESKMLEIFEEYGTYVPACHVETLCPTTLEDRDDETFYTATLDERQDETFYSETLEEREDETFSTTSFESCLW